MLIVAIMRGFTTSEIQGRHDVGGGTSERPWAGWGVDYFTDSLHSPTASNVIAYHQALCIISGIIMIGLGLQGLGLQGLYNATNCADNILGRFTIILQNQIARVDSFTNLTKRWVFGLNASISSHNLISFDKQFHARGPYTANARLPEVSCLNFGTFRTRSSLDLIEYLLLFDGVIISWM